MSYRNQISQAIKAQLLGKTAAGERVLTALDRPLDPATELPAIIVYTQLSKRGREDYGRSLIPRIVTVTIEGAVAATPADALLRANELVDAIETVMEHDTSLGGLVTDTQWLQSIADTTSHGSHTLGVCVLEYAVEMMTNAKPDGALEMHNDGFTAPPDTVYTDATPVPPEFATVGPSGELVPMPPPQGTACGEDGCNIPAWGGDMDVVLVGGTR